MSGPEDRSGDLYHADMGSDVRGGGVDLDKGGSGKDHSTVYGDDRHFSWDRDSRGNVSGVHGGQGEGHKTTW